MQVNQARERESDDEENENSENEENSEIEYKQDQDLGEDFDLNNDIILKSNYQKDEIEKSIKYTRNNNKNQSLNKKLILNLPLRKLANNSNSINNIMNNKSINIENEIYNKISFIYIFEFLNKLKENLSEKINFLSMTLNSTDFSSLNQKYLNLSIEQQQKIFDSNNINPKNGSFSKSENFNLESMELTYKRFYEFFNYLQKYLNVIFIFKDDLNFLNICFEKNNKIKNSPDLTSSLKFQKNKLNLNKIIQFSKDSVECLLKFLNLSNINFILQEINRQEQEESLNIFYNENLIKQIFINFFYLIVEYKKNGLVKYNYKFEPEGKLKLSFTEVPKELNNNLGVNYEEFVFEKRRIILIQKLCEKFNIKKEYKERKTRDVGLFVFEFSLIYNNEINFDNFKNNEYKKEREEINLKEKLIRRRDKINQNESININDNTNLRRNQVQQESSNSNSLYNSNDNQKRDLAKQKNESPSEMNSEQSDSKSSKSEEIDYSYNKKVNILKQTKKENKKSDKIKITKNYSKNIKKGKKNKYISDRKNKKNNINDSSSEEASRNFEYTDEESNKNNRGFSSSTVTENLDDLVIYKNINNNKEVDLKNFLLSQSLVRDSINNFENQNLKAENIKRSYEIKKLENTNNKTNSKSKEDNNSSLNLESKKPKVNFLKLNEKYLKNGILYNSKSDYQAYINKRKSRNTEFSKDNEQEKISFEELFNIIIIDENEKIRKETVKNITKICKKNRIVSNIIEGKDGIDCLYKTYKCINKNKKINLIISEEKLEFLNGIEAAEILNNIFSRKNFIRIPYIITCTEDKESSLLRVNSECIEKICSKPLKNHVLEALILNYFKK